jgi:hypothetical protein
MTGWAIGAPAAPGNDRDVGRLRRRKARADRRIGKHHVDDGSGAAAGEVLDGRIRLVGTSRRVDDGDRPAVLLGGGRRAGDVADVVRLGRGDGDDAEQLLLSVGEAAREHEARSRKSDGPLSHGVLPLMPLAWPALTNAAYRFVMFREGMMRGK